MTSQPSQIPTQKPFGGTGAPATRPPTWGNTMPVRRRTRIEPCLIPQVLQSRDGDVHGVNVDEFITGELLSKRYTRGNLRAYDLDTGETRTIHPFAGANRDPKHGASQYLKLDAPRVADTAFLE